MILRIIISKIMLSFSRELDLPDYTPLRESKTKSCDFFSSSIKTVQNAESNKLHKRNWESDNNIHLQEMMSFLSHIPPVS